MGRRDGAWRWISLAGRLLGADCVPGCPQRACSCPRGHGPTLRARDASAYVVTASSRCFSHCESRVLHLPVVTARPYLPVVTASSSPRQPYHACHDTATGVRRLRLLVTRRGTVGRMQHRCASRASLHYSLRGDQYLFACTYEVRQHMIGRSSAIAGGHVGSWKQRRLQAAVSDALFRVVC